MSFDKSFFKQHGKAIKKETKKYDAHAEARPVNFRKCRHKQVKVVDGELRCSCGAGWRGPRLVEVFNKLKGVKNG